MSTIRGTETATAAPPGARHDRSPRGLVGIESAIGHRQGLVPLSSAPCLNEWVLDHVRQRP